MSNNHEGMYSMVKYRWSIGLKISGFPWISISQHSVEQPCQAMKLWDLRCACKVGSSFFLSEWAEAWPQLYGVGYLKGLTSIWVSFSGGNDGFVSKKEGKIGFRRSFSQPVGECVCVCVNYPCWWVSEWERQGSDKKGTWEAEKSVSDAGAEIFVDSVNVSLSNKCCWRKKKGYVNL